MTSFMVEILFGSIDIRENSEKDMFMIEYITLPETNIAPGNGCLEDWSPFGMASWQVEGLSRHHFLLGTHLPPPYSCETWIWLEDREAPESPKDTYN